MTFSRDMFAKPAYAIAIAMAVFQIYYTAGFGIMEGLKLSAIFVAFAMVLILLLYPPFKVAEGQKEFWLFPVIDLCLAVLAVAIAAYICINFDEIGERMRYIDPVSDAALLLGFALIVLTLEVTRRTAGLPLCIVSLAFVLYFIWGDGLPRSLSHNGASLYDIAENMYLQGEGIYGVPIQLASSTLFGFMLFGAFLERSRMSSIFMDLACLLTKGAQGGPAKVSIFASALFGTISGSSAGNVYTTGVFTIPLMKRCGYRPAFAGAVEAVASTGGQIMPPIMGAAAFMMAELAGVSYLSVAKAALLPAILYYLALFIMIHFEARKHGIGALGDDMLPQKAAIIRKLYYLLPLVVLVAMMLMGRSLSVCANAATLSIFLLSFLSAETRFTFSSFLATLVQASKSSLMVVACCACSGIIVGAINYTGIGFKFINVITSLAGSNLFLMLILLMLTSFILGMGMPTTPAYIVVATLGAPALIKAGIIPVVAHMFVFYYAILSFITPPVCVAAYAGASLAKANPMKTGFLSMKLGVVAFIVPIMFVYEPSLLLFGDVSQVAMACVTAVIGVSALSGGMQGWFLRGCNLLQRVLLTVGGLCLFFPGFYTDIVGVLCVSSVAIPQYLLNRRDPVPLPDPVCMLMEDDR